MKGLGEPFLILELRTSILNTMDCSPRATSVELVPLWCLESMITVGDINPAIP